MLSSEEKDPKSRATFEKGQAMMASAFKGVQILARKDLAPDKVELKVRNDFGPIPDAPNMAAGGALVSIETLAKVGNEWKLNGSSKPHQAKWDSEGNVQTYAQ